MATPYRVIAIDGGGIRGILTARILERIDEVLPGFLKRVDLFAGTSTGGLLALGFASGKTPAELRVMYEKFANRVFADSLLDQLKDLGNLIGAEYSVEPLKEVIKENFDDLHLSDLAKKVLIATFQLDNQAQCSREGTYPDNVRTWKMKFFQNYPGPGSDGEQSVVDVAVRTSVAPAYFPVYQGYIDGGVAASNPAMCALAQALDPRAGGKNIAEVALLSLGTGYNQHYLPVQDADWGIVQWAPHLLNIMLESDQGMVDFQCRQVLDQHYLRVNPLLPREIGLGSIKYIPDLLETANKVELGGIIRWLEQYFI